MTIEIRELKIVARVVSSSAGRNLGEMDILEREELRQFIERTCAELFERRMSFSKGGGM